MQTKKFTSAEVFFLGLMLFSFFFGAGNLIFPPLLGQDAGTNFWPAILGFFVTGVGLPILGVYAIVHAGSDDPEDLSKPVHPKFAVLFTGLIALALGPLFAIPRTGTVSFEIAILPFLENSSISTTMALLVFSIIYFAIVYWLSLNPGNFIDVIGKMITPVLIAVILILFVRVFTGPLGTFSNPAEKFENASFFRGAVEGYLTMDTLAALVDGIIIAQILRARGIKETSRMRSITLKAGLIAGLCLIFVYFGLAYLGGTSSSAIGLQANGGAILSTVTNELFGVYGNIILGITILLACIPTATALVSFCANYFHQRFPKVSYKNMVLIFVIFSTLVSNVGLSQLIAFSVPVLVFMYPILIALIFLSLGSKWIKGRKEIYQMTILLTGIVALKDGLAAAGFKWGFLNVFNYLPFAAEGFGWLVPALVGALLGLIISKMRPSISAVDDGKLGA